MLAFPKNQFYKKKLFKKFRSVFNASKLTISPSERILKNLHKKKENEGNVRKFPSKIN
jgi:hypothetical protein